MMMLVPVVVVVPVVLRAQAAADFTARVAAGVHVDVRRSGPDRVQHLGKPRRSGIDPLSVRRGNHIRGRERAGDGRRIGGGARLRSWRSDRRSQIGAQEQHDAARDRRPSEVNVRLQHAGRQVAPGQLVMDRSAVVADGRLNSPLADELMVNGVSL